MPEPAIHDLIEARALAAPGDIAVMDGARQISYRTLNERADALARLLRDHGAGPEVVVALALPRGADLLVAMLGTLKAQAAYLPLDVDDPPSRAEHMLHDAGARLIVTDPHHAPRFSGLTTPNQLNAAPKPPPDTDPHAADAVTHAAAATPPNADTPTVKPRPQTGPPAGDAQPKADTSAADADTHVVVLRLTADSGAATALAPEGVASAVVGGEGLAYVVFTSGSTGRAKPVAVTHRSLVNHAREMGRRYGLTASDRVLQFASPAFDVLAEEVFPTWLAGGRVVVTPDPAAPSDVLEGFVRAAGVTVLNLPTPYWRQWVHDLDRDPRPLPGSLRLLVVGTERAATSTLAGWWRHAAVPVVNAYGLSETTITVTSRAFEPGEVPAGETLPIGTPIAGCAVFVLDAELRPVAPGGTGELYVGGTALARGYPGRPEATAERFVPHPGRPDELLLRTGDLVRRGPGDELEYVGRVDRQVKIRGHRVEPAEVEAVLHAHPEVARAHVRGEDGAVSGETRLVAYVEPHDDRRIPASASLRAHLRAALPDAMVPAAYVLLRALPRHPNGKIDVAALPALDPLQGRAAAPYAPPRTEMERALLAIWREALATPGGGIDDDFFELGGHSLSAARVVTGVGSLLDRAIAVRDVFAHPTVRELAGLLDTPETARPALPPLTRSRAESPAPLSYQQEQVWFHSRLAPESIAYQTQTTIRVAGPLDVAVLNRAVTEIVRRHEILRTTYHEDEGRLHQVVHPPEPVTVAEADLSGLPARARDERLDALVGDDLRRPFELSRLPLMRWTVIRLGPREHELVVVEHHVVHDGWSFSVLMHELTALYGAFAKGDPSPLAELDVQYGDYARWQRDAIGSAAMRARRARWAERLAHLPAPMELPARRVRPEVQTFRGDTIRADLPAGLPAALRDLCRRERVSPFMAMLAGFVSLLHRYSGADDLCVTSGFANRGVGGTERSLGMFVNTVVLRCDLGGDPTFRELVQRVRDVVLDAEAGQEFPFTELIRLLNPERDATRSPLIQVMFSSNDTPMPDLDFAGSAGTLFERANGSAKTDLNVVMIPRAQSRMGGSDRIDDRITLLWEYDTDVFESPVMREMLDGYVRLLERALADPETRVGDLPLLGERRRHQILREWGGGDLADPAEPLVPVAVARQARRVPDATAIRDGDRTLTYRELNEWADRLAARLCELGAGPDSVVGVLLPRGVELVVAELGIMKAGAAFLPLDPDHPAARLALLCTDAGTTVVVTAAEHAVPSGVTGVLLDDLPASSKPLPPIRGNQLAYVMYTSGSTGRPKGVMVEHASLATFTAWYRREYGVGPADRLAMVNAPAFDASIMDIWPALTAGASVHVADQETRLSPARLQNWLIENRIATTFLTTALGEALLALPWPADTSLRYLQTGGEVFRRRPDAGTPFQLVLAYGLTEDTVFSTTGTVSPAGPDDELPDIGRPITGTTTYVLDAALRPVPPGVRGELYLGGTGVARGYLGQPALTAERFVPDPFGTEPGGRLYRTGDLARHRPDGTLEFMGRTDAQVKLRGNRVEPGEIETVLSRHPAIAQAHVAVRDDGPGHEKRLVAYLVPYPGDEIPSPPDLRAHLERELPSFMVPAACVRLDRIPLNANGKVDHAALPVPDPFVQGSHEDAATPTERVVAEVWGEVLKLPRVSVLDNFFDLGGHSMLVHRVRDRLVELLGRGPTIVECFQYTTVRALARHIDGHTGDRPDEVHGVQDRRSGLTRLGARRAQRARTSGTEGGGAR
ncbi:amino acid adenylation domain-containing protein [Spirillospora sp. CA-294931]|uniref:amino acid adenylation domain-containing protein n=1 Tax=Spirillospora sp. CA-294931 TaxID=3240042 RepID=UPI003D933B9E